MRYGNCCVSGGKVLTLLIAGVITAFTAAAASPAHLLNTFGRTQLIIDTSGHNCVLFDVYIAQHPEQRSQGLMFIESMGTYEGMLFVYPESARISMWMKNTLISLDMLFIDAQLNVAHIHMLNPLPTTLMQSHPWSATQPVFERNLSHVISPPPATLPANVAMVNRLLRISLA